MGARWMPALLLLALVSPATAAEYRCMPTRPDADGPFYRPDAPLRDAVGSGYLLFGTVKSASDCRPLPGARIEIWLNGPDGRYDDRWRATVIARGDGRYAFSSHVPVPYGSRPPHIHLLVNVPGHAELITQHYPRPGAGLAQFDLVLIPLE
jgi:protocatechuate 3,4-dioxygenase beta subunit